MPVVESVLAGLLLWVLHFLQTPEGQAILGQTEDELIAELEAFQAAQGATPPPPQPPAQPSAQQPQSAASLRGTAKAFVNPRKVSSATDEQPLTGG